MSKPVWSGPPVLRGWSWGDAVAILALAALLYLGVRLAVGAPAGMQGPDISLAPGMLPWYAALSMGRMAGAYALSLAFTLIVGYLAAYSRRAEMVILPALDILQSVPILSFLPVVLLGLSAVLPQALATELAAVVLIFTSQVWNMTFSWYQSLTTIPNELREASAIFQLNVWMRLRHLDLPFAAIGLVWNSMMSWAGGWFFLMASEIFTVQGKDFRLPGLGAYLQEAATQGDLRAIAWGVGTLVTVIVALDQFVWRPLLAWAERFKLEMVSSGPPATSWFLDYLHRSRLFSWLMRVCLSALEYLDIRSLRHTSERVAPPTSWLSKVTRDLASAALLAGLAYGTYRAGEMMLALSGPQWTTMATGLGGTFLRVTAALLIALAWTVPVGLAIGSNPRLATWLQPVVQVVASVPATALFPVLVLFLAQLPGGLNLASIVLMLMGTQWYMLFNVIAGTSAIPQDLKYTASLLQLGMVARWRTLFLPALFPYILTGCITASGGAWNASIIAEYVEFGGRHLQVTGLGALISEATAQGDYPMLLTSTLVMMLSVVFINRLLWRRLYRAAAERFRLE